MSVWRKQYPNAPLPDPSNEWFVNRKKDLDYLWKWAVSLPNKGSFSITGLRRTGKSTMLAKLYNRLFFEQERVMPIHISFANYLHKKEPITAQQFADQFVVGAVRSYLAFKHKRPELYREQIEYPDLEKLAEELSDKVTQDWFRRHKLAPKNNPIPSHRVVQFSVDFLAATASEEQPMVVMIDEFQVLTQVMYPEDNRVMDITDSFQRASESRNAPLLVSGSSISMLQGEALGGLLSGRFAPFHIGPLESAHAAEMVLDLGKAKSIPVTEEFAREIAKTTNGYPYSIECIMQSRSESVDKFPDVSAVDEVVKFELSDHAGVLGRHYEEEYGKYAKELNGDHITRKILYWITNQNEIKLHLTPGIVGRAINVETMAVKEALEKLCQLDIIERIAGNAYSGPTDPLMRLYLNYTHYLDVEELSPDAAATQLERRLNEMQGEFNRRTGHFAEIIVAGVAKAFNNRKVDGLTYFNIEGDIELPKFSRIHRRHGVIEDGIPHEIDLIGEYSRRNRPDDVDFNSNAIYAAWMISVRYRGQRMGVKDVHQFMRDVAIVQNEKRYGEIVRWYFSKTGFTKDARALLQAEGIYYSDLVQFNQLAQMFDLMALIA